MSIPPPSTTSMFPAPPAPSATTEASEIMSVATQEPESDLLTRWRTVYNLGATHTFTDTNNRAIEIEIDLRKPLRTRRILAGSGTLVARTTVLAVTNTPGDPFDCTGMLGREYILRVRRVAESCADDMDVIDEAGGVVIDVHDSAMVLPDVITSAALSGTEDSPQSSLYEQSTPGTQLERRSLRIISGAVRPITILTTNEEVKIAFRQIAHCCNWLNRESQTLHRDISLNNLVLRRKFGNWLAVLADFDLSSPVNEKMGPSHHECIGTMPFLAIELLRGGKIQHVQRHDLEALYWSFVWLTVRYHNGKSLQSKTHAAGMDEYGKPKTVTVPAPLGNWLVASSADLCAYKYEWLVDTILCTRNFTELMVTWHRSLRKLISDGAWEANVYRERLRWWKRLKANWALESNPLSSEPVRPEYDEATQGGVFTWEAFEKCIQN